MGRPRNFSREEVLEKAMPLFWKRGFADTGLQDLEKATGVNKSGLYTEFKNKEDLFLAALRHYNETRKGRDLLSVEPLGWGNIERFLKFKLARKDGMKGCFAVNSMRETELLPAEAQDIMTESRANLKRLFLKNIAAEKTKTPPEALTEILSTFFSGICIEQNLNAEKNQARKVEDFVRFLRAQ
ncbi:MAG: regulatory protein TetR [Fibrobacteres bacterium]|nr:regulatory protein TetR [Fibrobacterota bacterium]